MENASKALIIAGAILLSILIIAIGMMVYTNAQSTITSSLSQMSDSEKTAFNSTWENYEGKATGSQIKNMIGNMITNSSTYAEEPAKIVALRIVPTSSNALCCVLRPSPNNTNNYVTTLGKIKNSIETKHTYWVELVSNTAGVVDTINVYYDPTSSVVTGTSYYGSVLPGTDSTTTTTPNP